MLRLLINIFESKELLVLGFYMRFDDDSAESAKTVKQWNVKIISISRNKRHQDRAAALDVSERLEEFMRGTLTKNILPCANLK
ncbi:hypothetical protein AgCh_029022 [Apium graveolens]